MNTFNFKIIDFLLLLIIINSCGEPRTSRRSRPFPAKSSGKSTLNPISNPNNPFSGPSQKLITKPSPNTQNSSLHNSNRQINQDYEPPIEDKSHDDYQEHLIDPDQIKGNSEYEESPEDRDLFNDDFFYEDMRSLHEQNQDNYHPENLNYFNNDISVDQNDLYNLPHEEEKEVKQRDDVPIADKYNPESHLNMREKLKYREKSNIDFRKLKLETQAKEIQYQEELKQIDKDLNIDTADISYNFLKYNPYIKLCMDTSLYNFIVTDLPLHEYIRDTFYHYRDKLILQGNNPDDIYFEDDVDDRGRCNHISFSSVINALNTSAKIDGIVDAVVETEVRNRNPINNAMSQAEIQNYRKEVIGYLYASTSAISECLYKNQVIKAGIGLSYLAPLIGSNHCHGRTLQMLNKTSEVYGKQSFKPSTFARSVYDYLHDFKIECVNKAIIQIYNGSGNGAADVHYKNWIFDKIRPIISTPGQEISSNDDVNFTVPNSLKRLSDEDIRTEFLKVFKTYYNKETILDSIDTQLSNNIPGKIITMEKFYSYTKNKGLNQEEVIDVMDGKINSDTLTRCLINLGVLAVK